MSFPEREQVSWAWAWAYAARLHLGKRIRVALPGAAGRLLGLRAEEGPPAGVWEDGAPVPRRSGSDRLLSCSGKWKAAVML